MPSERDGLGFGLKETELNPEVAEHELKALKVFDHGVEVGERPQLVFDDLGSLPSERLNPAKSPFLVSVPNTMDNGITFAPGCIDLCKQVEDNFFWTCPP